MESVKLILCFYFLNQIINRFTLEDFIFHLCIVTFSNGELA